MLQIIASLETRHPWPDENWFDPYRSQLYREHEEDLLEDNETEEWEQDSNSSEDSNEASRGRAALKTRIKRKKKKI